MRAPVASPDHRMHEGPVVQMPHRGPSPQNRGASYTVKELPQPQPPDAFGFLNVKPEPIIVVT